MFSILGRESPSTNITDLVITDASEYEVSCSANLCAPNWTQSGDVVKSASSIKIPGISQRTDGNTSRLLILNPNVSESGTFYCRTALLFFHDSSFVALNVKGEPN